MLIPAPESEGGTEQLREILVKAELWSEINHVGDVFIAAEYERYGGIAAQRYGNELRHAVFIIVVTVRADHEVFFDDRTVFGGKIAFGRHIRFKRFDPAVFEIQRVH